MYRQGSVLPLCAHPCQKNRKRDLESRMKKRIFIGSSSESKDLAGLLQQVLSTDFECTLWYEDFFSLGKHYYTDLIQKIITFDYAIMIGGEDDFVKRISTQSEKIAPRDNIYLEYGLFSGILSPNKVLLLMHENCKVASDLAGMSLSMYKDSCQAVAIAKDWIEEKKRSSALRAISRKDVGLMPSAGIAVGYYYNFLKPFVDKLLSSEEDKKFKLKVLVPSFVCDDVSFYSRELIARLGLERDLIQSYRILRAPNVTDEIQMYDIPGTILALFKTVNYVFEISDGNTEDTLCAKARALDDFYDNLRVLVSNDYAVRSIVSLERFCVE